MKYLKLFKGLAVLIFAGSAIFATPRIIRIKKITCFDQYGPCSGDLTAKLIKSEGKSYDKAKREVLTILSKENSISLFSAQYKLPDSIKVSVIIRKPKYAVSSKDSGEVSLIDSNGVVLATSKSTRLPKLMVKGNVPHTGEKVSANYMFMLNIIQKINYLYQVDKADVEGDSLVIIYPQNIRIIFPVEGDADKLVGSARLILSRLKADDKDSKIGNISVIDLRFKNPILK